MLMKNKQITKKLIFVTVSFAGWLLLWWLAAKNNSLNFLFPTPVSTLKALGALVITASFWRTVLNSVLRILLGLAIGVLFGIILALLSKLSSFIYTFISLGMTFIKSTPVASVVMILCIIILDNSSLPVIIAVLMVMPIIWQNLIDGFDSVDGKILEMARIFEFSRKKKLKYIWVPTLLNYLIPAVITSIGLAWKSGIAAEIIAYTKNSIGKKIYLSKGFSEYEELMAWTLTVVILSLIFEFLAKYLLRRYQNARA